VGRRASPADRRLHRGAQRGDRRPTQRALRRQRGDGAAGSGNPEPPRPNRARPRRRGAAPPAPRSGVSRAADRGAGTGDGRGEAADRRSGGAAGSGRRDDLDRRRHHHRPPDPVPGRTGGPDGDHQQSQHRRSAGAPPGDRRDHARRGPASLGTLAARGVGRGRAGEPAGGHAVHGQPGGPRRLRPLRRRHGRSPNRPRLDRRRARERGPGGPDQVRSRGDGARRHHSPGAPDRDRRGNRGGPPGGVAGAGNCGRRGV
ncbi:MAG: predicted biotin regulatory protein BioR (GntR family), partial [uncultured Thermomicrobiales bacterium]